MERTKREMKKSKDTREPGKDDRAVYWYIFRILSALGKDNATAPAEAAYYVALIKLAPTSINNIASYANKLTNTRKNYVFYRKASNYLLKDGLIAQIMLTQDFNYSKAFGNEAFLPVNPKTFLDLNISKVADHFNDVELGLVKERIEKLSQEFHNKFSIDALKNMCTRGISKEEVSNITLYYSGMWVTYTLADNIQQNSTVSMILNGTRVCDGPHMEYYKKILDTDIKIRTILTTTNEIDQIKNRFGLIQSPKKTNIIIKHAPKESYKTCRMTIVDNVFALDGRKLLHLKDAEPSYTGTLYLDDKYMKIIKDIFETVWNRLDAER